MKPIIVAIAGPSCVGKDTLQRKLFIELCKQNFKVNNIISTTTRPPRVNETENDYHFISIQDWDKCDFFEETTFRGWYYGTQKKDVLNDLDAVNLGVFNLAGIKSLWNLSDEYYILPVYLIVNWKERLRRSIKREHKITLEMLRRLYVDYKDFKKNETILFKKQNCLVYLGTGNFDKIVQDIMGQIKKYQSF